MKNEISIAQGPNNTSLSGKVFSIMSEGYRQGLYTDAMNAQCMITVETNVTNSIMILNVHEFAPFLNSSGFCLSVDDKKQNETCSGSRKYKNFFTVYRDKKQRTLKMEKTGSPNHKLQVRFWMKITG